MLHVQYVVPIQDIIAEYQVSEVIAMADYVRNLTNSEDNVHINIVYIALRLKKQSGRDPTMDEIVEMFWSSRTCYCLDDIPKSKCLEILKLLFAWEWTNWDCMAIQLVDNYKTMNKKYPSRDEMREYFENVQKFINNYEQYDEENKIRVGAKIDDFASPDYRPGDLCGLCFQPIMSHHYKLPCGHKFHLFPQECLESSVKQWFETNTKCPLCRVDVRDIPKEPIKE